MMRKTLWIGGVALAVAALVAPAAWTEEAAPVVDYAKVARMAAEAACPDNVDPVDIKGEAWTFDFKCDPIEPIVVLTPGGEKEVYWYIVYTVTNRSDKEHEFIPSFLLFSDTGKTTMAGMYPTVFKAITERRKIRFLESSLKMFGKVLPGEDNARTGVAIFGPIDRATDAFAVFVGGLSGQYIERPKKGAKADAPADEKVVRLHKTLAIKYKLPGDKWWKNQDPPVLVSKTWTWR